METLYHYTTASCLKGILRDKEIRPATAGIVAGEIPAVWLSVNLKWEQTAKKAIIDRNGNRRTATLAELIEREKFVVRIEIDQGKVQVIPRREIVSALAIPTKVYHGLIKASKVMGANPNEWRAVAGSIPSSAFLRIEHACTYAPISWTDSGWQQMGD